MKKDIMALADDFADKFYNGDILVITPPEDMKSTGDKVNDTARMAAHALIRVSLGDAIHKHLTKRSMSTARKLVKLITSARNQGLVVESETYISKSKRLEQENIQLKEENVKLQKEVKRLSKLNDDLHIIVEGLSPKRNKGSMGDSTL